MNSFRAAAFLLASAMVWSVPASAQQTYHGVCDASAAVAIGTTHFLMAADEYREKVENEKTSEDRGDFLLLYSRDEPDKAPVAFRLPGALRADKEDAHRELDTEGAARIGKRIFWITSHGRSRAGKARRNRYRLYATDVEGEPNALAVDFVGSYDRLVTDLLDKANWRVPDHFRTERAIRAIKEATQLEKQEDPELAPKSKGLNIEGLAADGSDLFIGFRNPIPDGKAIVVILQNADALVTGKATAAKFDGPFELDLGKRGIRGMAYVPRLASFLLLAGPKNGDGAFTLFNWAGPRSSSVAKVGDLKSGDGASPEAVIVYAGVTQVQVLSDEGSKVVDGKPCSERPTESQSFSSQSITVE